MSDGFLAPDEIVQRLHATPSLAMRSKYIGDYCDRLNGDDLPLFLSILATDAFAGKPPYPELWLATWLGLSMKKARLERLREQSTEDPLIAVMIAPAAANELKKIVPKYGRALTLGERRAVARMQDRTLLERARLDPDPIVIENLLRNQRITENDVVRAATQRPAHVDVLETIYLDTKWISRVRVRRAILFNPSTPLRLAFSLLPLADDMALREIENDNTLNPALRQAARALRHEQASASALRMFFAQEIRDAFDISR